MLRQGHSQKDSRSKKKKKQGKNRFYASWSSSIEVFETDLEVLWSSKTSLSSLSLLPTAENSLTTMGFSGVENSSSTCFLFRAENSSNSWLLFLGVKNLDLTGANAGVLDVATLVEDDSSNLLFFLLDSELVEGVEERKAEEEVCNFEWLVFESSLVISRTELLSSNPVDEILCVFSAGSAVETDLIEGSMPDMSGWMCVLIQGDWYVEIVRNKEREWARDCTVQKGGRREGESNRDCKRVKKATVKGSKRRL